MKYFVSAICTFLFLMHLSKDAQTQSHTFGLVPIEEMRLTQYEKDPEAGALILYNKGKSIFFENNNGLDIKFTQNTRIKIFNKSGFRFAEIQIPYYQEGFGKTEIIKDIEAYTYTMENGLIKKTSLDLKNVFTEKITESIYVKKFAMPNVKDGAIIEYKYVLESPFIGRLPDWEFQSSIPTLFSEYEASLIPFFEYVYIFQGAPKIDILSSTESEGIERYLRGTTFKEMDYKFAMKDVPAFKDETFITSREDYLIKIDFQLAKINYLNGTSKKILTTWPDLNKALLKHEDFGKYINASEKLSVKILESEFNLPGLSSIKKCESIVNYVKKGFQWNGYYRTYAAKNPKEFLNEKTGSSAEINLFLTGMLKASGLEAHPVLISTRKHGRINADYPFEHSFNYVLCLVKIDNNFILIDGTEELTAFNRISARCINEKGLIVMKDAEPWVSLNQNILSITENVSILEIQAEKDSIHGDFSIKRTEYEAVKFKNLYHNKISEITDALRKDGFNEIKEIKTLNFDNPQLPYALDFKANYPLEQFDNKLYIPPFLNLPMDDNELKQTTRLYPIDMTYAEKNIFKSQIKIPENYTVSSLPKGFMVDNDLVQIIYKSESLNGTIRTEGSYWFKKVIYDPADYSRIKEHMDQIVEVFNKKISLVKK